MGINLKNAVVCTAVGAVVSGLLATNLNAITAAATYSTANLSAISSAPASGNSDSSSSTTSTISSTTTSTFTSLDVWINKLAEAESGNRARIKVLDVNGRYSYGCLQFQMATFKSYSTRYGLVDPDAINSWEEQIYNCQLQKQIAKRMIQEKPSNWRHWGYTVLHKGTGLPPAKETIVGELAFAQ